jgi:hypothetical protein
MKVKNSVEENVQELDHLIKFKELQRFSKAQKARNAFQNKLSKVYIAEKKRTLRDRERKVYCKAMYHTKTNNQKKWMMMFRNKNR